MIYNKSNIEILLELDHYVAGHDEAKKALINLVNRSKVRHHQRWGKLMKVEELVSPMKVLLIGASGTGKTHLVESLSKVSDFPFLRFDATQLNVTGASDGIKSKDFYTKIEAHAKMLVEKSDKYHSIEGAIDQMVVFIDEIDKLGNSFDSSGNWNKHVQSNFLSVFDNKDPRYAGLSFIFAGAFTEITKKRAKEKSLGFTPSKHILDDVEIETKVVKSGLLPELVGRITSIVELDEFTIEDYKKLLQTRLLNKKQLDMNAYQVGPISLTEEQIDIMAAIAHKSEQGIRSLQRQLDIHFSDIEFYYEEHKYDLPKELTYDGDNNEQI